MRYHLVHDTKSAGFLTGVTITRLLKRLGHTVEVHAGLDRTGKTELFWRETVDTLPLGRDDQTILCCITFWDYAVQCCLDAIARIEERTGRLPMVVTHRWPDGYLRTRCEILVPPFDILERYGKELTSDERELLRLSLIVSRQADRDLISPADLALADTLDVKIRSMPGQLWCDLEEGRSDVLHSPACRMDSEGSLENLGTLDCQSDHAYLFTLSEPTWRFAEKATQALLSQHTDDLTAIGIGVTYEDNGPKIVLVRQWGQRHLPSIKWLLAHYGHQFDLPSAHDWRGPQDAQSFRFPRAAVEPSRLPYLKQTLIDFAKHAHSARSGGRQPVAGLSRLLYNTAVAILSDLDKSGRLTPTSSPSLSFDPYGTVLLVDVGNRGDEPRSTLVLKLDIKSADAAAFMFGHEAYNLMKLERHLEGALLGMASQRGAWLGVFSLPHRLRIDTRISSQALDGLPSALAADGDITALTVSEAVNFGIVKPSSSIHRIITKRMDPEKSKLLLFRGSEIIGPSFQYGLFAAALVHVLSEHRATPLHVLDLFAGSAAATKVVLRERPETRCVCVDVAVDAKSAGLDNRDNVLWLRQDYRQALAGIDKRFDVIAMDPPHNVFLEMATRCNDGGRAVLDELVRHTSWLLVYQGHLSQIGRGFAMKHLLSAHFGRHVAAIRIGSEIITVGGPAVWSEAEGFEAIVDRVLSRLKEEVKILDVLWEIARVDRQELADDPGEGDAERTGLDRE